VEVEVEAVAVDQEDAQTSKVNKIVSYGKEADIVHKRMLHL